MRIILNSDVLHMTRLLTTALPAHIEQFCREAAVLGSVLVLPRTVVLENERHQRELYAQAVAKLEDAASLLSKWGIVVPRFNAREQIARADLLTMLGATGITIESHDPTLDDYRDAEHRASFHLSPQAPDTKSDEMRDLIIWAVSLRVATHDGGAILISRDKVHLDERGTEEASAAGLHRVDSFDDALDWLGRISVAGELARSVLTKVWDDLKQAGLPLPEKVPSRRFLDLNFVADEAGHVNTRLRFEITTSDGPLSGAARIFQVSPSTIQVVLSELLISKIQWKSGLLNLEVNGELPKFTRSLDERLPELRRIIKEEGQ